MVADLIEISKHDAGSMRVELEELAVVSAIETIVRRLGHDGIPLQASSTAAASLVSIDLQRLSVVFRNVIENAIAYGGGPTQITVDADDAWVRICVDDAGPGLDPGERERVFDRFARGTHGERRSTADGSGLGLSLARENMSRMHGEIRAEPGPGGTGARFVLTLPRVDT